MTMIQTCKRSAISLTALALGVSLSMLLSGCEPADTSSSQIVRGANSAPLPAMTFENSDGKMVQVRLLDNQGRLAPLAPTPKPDLSEEQWKKQLSSEEYHILREQGTERAFTSELLKIKEPGIFACRACGLPLFETKTKFESGTGWPSFYQPMVPENVATKDDSSWGMTRTEVHCARCEGHLGHIFNDGPKPTGLRYCLNGLALNFLPQSQLDLLSAAASTTAAPATTPATSPASSPDAAVPAMDPPALDENDRFSPASPGSGTMLEGEDM